MFSYQWPFRGKGLVRVLNYANSFAFMLYGWDAGEWTYCSFPARGLTIFHLLRLTSCVVKRCHWRCARQPTLFGCYRQSNRHTIPHFHCRRHSAGRCDRTSFGCTHQLAPGPTQDCHLVLLGCHRWSHPADCHIWANSNTDWKSRPGSRKWTYV